MVVSKKAIILYIITSGITVVLTGIGSLLLSLEKYDFFPHFYFKSRLILNSSYLAAIILFLFFASIIIALFFILRNIIYLNPSRILLLHKEELSNKNIMNFLFKKYGIPAPHSSNYYGMVYDRSTFDKLMNVISSESEISYEEVLTEEERQKIKKNKETEREFQKDFSRYEDLKRKIKNTPDVFEGFSIINLKAIVNTDVATIKEACDMLVSISKSFLNSLSGFEKKKGKWYPYSQLPSSFARYIIELISIQLEACERQNSPSLALYFIEAMSNIASVLLEYRHIDAFITLISFWKETADKSLGKNPPIFKKLILSYEVVGDEAFEMVKRDDEDARSPLDEIFRQLGWLAERLLTKKKLEIKPIMHDGNYYNEYDVILDTILKYGSKYDHDLPYVYPLIYFDAVHVLFSQLLDIYQSKEEGIEKIKHEIKNHIFNCVYIYLSFAQKAIKISNSKAVALCAFKLRQCYDQAEHKGAKDVAKSIIVLITEMCITVAANPDKMTKGSFLGGSVEKYLEETILMCPYRSEVRNEVFENFIRVEGNYEAKWRYIKSLGIKMGTNFGLMFDAFTGEDYASNDPRRR